jgi:putative ABC transport system permease protein
VNNALGGNSPWGATTQHEGGKFYTVAVGLVGLLALMVAVAAGLGVLNTVLITTRDRVHDLGIFKALGMRPGQMLTMVMCRRASTSTRSSPSSGCTRATWATAGCSRC